MQSNQENERQDGEIGCDNNVKSSGFSKEGVQGEVLELVCDNNELGCDMYMYTVYC